MLFRSLLALECAARRDRSDPQDVNTDDYTDGRQQPSKQEQFAALLAAGPQSWSAAPENVRCNRPHAHQSEQQHDLFEQGIKRSVGEQDSGDRIPHI